MVKTLLQTIEERFPPTDGFHVTETLIEDLKRELQGSRPNPPKIASRYGVPAALVRYIMQESPNPNTVFTKVSDDGWGRKSLRPHLVSRKAAGDAWPDADKDKIEAARESYDMGHCEICQGRDGDFILLYAITRKRPIKRIYLTFSENIVEVEDDEG